MSFIEELWQSVFTPGTTPALIKAVHVSFILLFASLAWVIYLSRSIHFVNLFVIALLLYGTVCWFIGELQKSKLMTNEELDQAAEEAEQKRDAGETSGAKVGPKVEATTQPVKRKT